jgi:hypothetical protein
LRDRAARQGKPVRIGIVLQAFRTAKFMKNPGTIIIEAASSRIRGSQIEKRPIAGAQSLYSGGIPGSLQVPVRSHGELQGRLTGECKRMAAPQGFEPQYADSESAVLPLNEGAVRRRLRRNCVLLEYIGHVLSGQLFTGSEYSRRCTRTSHSSINYAGLFFSQHLKRLLLQNP